MAKEPDIQSFRDIWSTAVGLVAMIAIFGVIIYGFADIESTMPRGIIIAGNPIIVPSIEELPKPPVFHNRVNGERLVIKSDPMSMYMSKSELAPTKSVFFIDVLPTKYARESDGGSGFFVAKNVFATAAHLVSNLRDDHEIRIYCNKQEPDAVSPVMGDIIAINISRDVALLSVKGCLNVRPLRLSQKAPGPNDILVSYGFFKDPESVQVEEMLSRRTVIPGANFAKGWKNIGHVRPWVKMVSPHLVGISGDFIKGNSGGLVYWAKGGKVAGLISARDFLLSRSFFAPSKSILQLMKLHGIRQ
jgi:hypothetical protein